MNENADIVAAQAGDREMADRLIRANIPLVRYVIHLLTKRGRICDYSTAYSEGLLCLNRCVMRFDTSLGWKFSTYACRSLYRSISDSQRFSRNAIPFDESLCEMDWERSRPHQGIEPIEAWKLAEKTLTPKEFQIVAARMKGDTLEVCGNRLGVKKERARQIQNGALKKLRKRVMKQLSETTK